MQYKFALIFSVFLCIVSANSTTKKDIYTNILKFNRSNDIQTYPVNPDPEKATDIVSRHVENVRNKNKQINLKLAQRTTTPSQNGNFSKLAEKLRKYKINVTAAKQDAPDIDAPTMIPIFRPLTNNIRNVQPIEFVKTNEEPSKTHNLKANISENVVEVVYTKIPVETQTKDGLAYSTNGEINPNTFITGNENFEMPYVKERQEKVLQLTDILCPNKGITSAQPTQGVIGERINSKDKTKCNNIHPQFKIEYIPADNKLSLNKNTQNLFTLTENLKPSTDDLNTVQNVITHNIGLPNNMIIESMRFVPLSEIQNDLASSNVVQNVSPQTVIQDPIVETYVGKPIFEENSAVYRKDNQIASNTGFNIPCFTATDILEDLGGYNQNIVQPIMYPNSENVGTNLPSNTESGSDVTEDDALAIIFKPKDISLLKVYGDILKKITLTVLVPYHVSKLVT